MHPGQITAPLAALVLLLPASAASGQASARQSDFTSAHHGVQVADPYRWLEAMDSPEVVSWARSQDAFARGFAASASSWSEMRDAIRRTADHTRYTAPIARGDRLFNARLNASATRVDLLVHKAGRERVLVSADELAADGEVAGWVLWPDPAGHVLAYGVAEAGSRWSELRFRDVQTGRDLPDRVPGLLGRRLSSVSWAPDGTGVYYDAFDLPPREERQSAPLTGSRVAFHALGTPLSSDRVVVDAPEGSIVTHEATDDGRWHLVVQDDGAGGADRVWAVPGEDLTSRRLLVEGTDARFSLVGAVGDELWLYTDLDAANGRVVGVDVRSPAPENWRTVVPERRDPIDTWTGARAVGDAVVVGYRSRGLLELRAFDPGAPDRADSGAVPDGEGSVIPLPRIGSVWSGATGLQGRPEFYYVLSGFADPGTVYRHDLSTGRSAVWLQPELPYDPMEIVTRRVFYSGPAGDSLPVYLSYHRDTPPDGTRPVMMYGYAFGGWSASPWFRPHMGEWFQRGGTMALPALRGGGEFGREWMRAGLGASRQNAVDDYIAVARSLIEQGLASPGLLVAESNSAGASVVGAAIVQEPDLFGASLLGFPLLDLLRYEAFTGGRRWRSQLGSVENEAEFRALLAYSPIHTVRQGRCYPPTLVTPGELDETTPPFHAFKFVATLQAAQSCGRHPVLLRMAWGAGHAYGKDQETTLENFADQFAFLQQVLDGWSGERRQ